MRPKKLSFDDDKIAVYSASITHLPTKVISLGIYYNDIEDNNIDFACSVSVNFISPIEESQTSDVDSIFTLNNIMFGESLMDAVTKFINMYSVQGLFRACHLSDSIFVSYIDGSSEDRSIVDILKLASKNPEFSDRIKGTQFDSTIIKEEKSPKLLK